MNAKIKTAVFPIAGMGTRFLPATKSIPKEMLTVLDKPIIEWSVKEAHSSGIEKMIFVISSNKSSIFKHFDKDELLEFNLQKKKKKKEIKLIKQQCLYGEIFFVIQEEPKGLGHAVCCAKNLIQEDKFAVILPDDIILSNKPVTKQLIDVSNKNNCSVLGVEKVPKKEVNKYGILKISKKSGNTFNVNGITEKPKINDAPSNLSVVGRYILDYEIFNFLEKNKKGYGGEIQLTDGIEYLLKNKSVMGCEFEGKRFDCGNKLGFIKANVFFGMNDAEIKKSLKDYLKTI